VFEELAVVASTGTGAGVNFAARRPDCEDAEAEKPNITSSKTPALRILWWVLSKIASAPQFFVFC
jgi:hypothetical protein